MNLNDCIELLQRTYDFFNLVPDDKNLNLINPSSLTPAKAKLDQIVTAALLMKQSETLLTISKQLDYELDISPLNRLVLSNTLKGYKHHLITLINEQLVTLLSQPQELSFEIADKLFALYDASLLDDCQRGILFFLTARLLCAAKPLISYQYTLKAFEIFPSLTKRFSPAIDYTFTKVKEDFTASCPICQSTDSAPYFNAQIVMAPNFTPNFSPCKLWMKCAHCHNLFAYNFPINLSIDSTYKPLQKNFINQSFAVPLSSLPKYGKLLNNLRQYHSGKHYLDVGVGTGELLAVALEMGLEIDAVEILPSLCQQMKMLLGVDVYCSDILQFDTCKKYDFITMGDIIEHTKSPVAAISKAYELLDDDDGLLWISTPNYTSAFSRMMKFADPMWIEPWHYTYFCSASFLPLLRKNGFRILHYQVSDRYNGSMEIIAQKN